MIIAVDAAGGDYFPQNPIEGALLAIAEHETLTIILLGPHEAIKEELSKHDYDESRVMIQDAPEVIGTEEAPAAAVKNKQQSSIVMGLGLHKQGRCDGFVSAGNTGALLAASTFILGRLQGVLRPTIAAYYPTLKGFRLLLDAGANLDMKPQIALQFAKMGQVFCQHILHIDSPTVGVLNVGEEEEKGTDEVKHIYAHLKTMDGFVGNVEGRDIFSGKADVYLTNGFVGNILLKFGESIPSTIMKLVRDAMPKLNINPTEAQAVQKLLHVALSPFNYERVGGIPFLGVNGVSLVGHGGSSAVAIKNMINAAISCVKNEVNAKIVAALH